MTREQARELLPIIKAFSEGKTIQILCDGEKNWRDCLLHNVQFEALSDHYRVKPEPEDSMKSSMCGKSSNET